MNKEQALKRAKRIQDTRIAVKSQSDINRQYASLHENDNNTVKRIAGRHGFLWLGN